MTALRYGVIGCGVIGPVHANALAQLPDAQLVAVCDVEQERAGKLAAEYDVPHTCTDYRTLLERKDIDVVCICTPHYLHGRMAVDAAQAGKHVFCEKPMAISVEDMDAMIAAADASGVQLGICFQHRFDPVVADLKRAIEAGKFGTLLMGGAHCRCIRNAAYYNSAEWRGTWQYEGGGVLINQAIHTLDLMLWLFGEAVSVSGSYATLCWNDFIEVEDTISGVVTFASGAQGVVAATSASNLNWDTRLHVFGSAGSTVVNTGQPEIMYLNTSEAIEFTRGEDDSCPTVGKACYGNSHIRALNAFTRAVLNDTPYPIDGREGRKAAETVLALYQASRTQSIVPLPLRCATAVK